MHSTAMRGNEKLKCHVRLESLPQASLSRFAHISPPPYHSTAVCVMVNNLESATTKEKTDCGPLTP